MSDPTYYQIQILAALKEIHKELAWFRAREEAKDKGHLAHPSLTSHAPHTPEASQTPE
jgi:hypothetical protein